MRKKRAAFWFILPFLVLFTLLFLLQVARAQGTAADELQAVWQHVRESGAFHFSVDLTQTVRPRPTLHRPVISSRETRLYMEGETDQEAEFLEMTLWKGGGSVMSPESGIQIKIEDGRTYGRHAGSPWQEIDDFSGLFAPNGDFMAFLAAAGNVVRHEPESRRIGNQAITFTRYSFDINGPRYAEHMRKEMTRQMAGSGELPPGIELEAPQFYTDMTGSGEIWVGINGLPMRQIFHLKFAESADNSLANARIEMNFSRFSKLPAATQAATFTQQLNATTGRTMAKISSAAVSPQGFLTVAALIIVIISVVVVISRSGSRRVYAAVVLGVIASMLIAPLLGSYHVGVYAQRQADKQAEKQQEEDQLQREREQKEILSTPNFDPNADPLAVTAETTNTTGEDSKYFDSSCSSDPSGDADGDNLTNLQECLIGTLPGAADTDKDGVDDNLEVVGFQLEGNTETWYTNPLDQDSNKDGLSDGQEWNLDANGDSLPDDTDGDNIPDLWDEDNDGDGVPDDLDLSPHSSSLEAPTFTGNNPFQLIIDDLNEDKITKVVFQLQPTNADHLWYTNNVLDWQDNDLQGQIQDSDGKTFYDVDPTLDPYPNDLGDMRMVPMLEIEVTGTPDSLANAETLKLFGISTLQSGSNTQTAYVPLQLVTDSTGEKNVAFSGAMYYEGAGSWGNAHKVRLVWLVQALVDVCDTYENNVCSSYKTLNDLQIVQTYSDNWTLTGLEVSEDHFANMAMIYEDPSLSNDSPLFMESLYELAYGLDRTFLAGADCENVDANDKCIGGDGQLDITVNDIATRFNHATNSGVSDEERWGIDNVFSVEENSYSYLDLALFDTAITRTTNVLDANFTSLWSSDEPITPTIMFAWEHQYRAVNLDGEPLGSPNVDWSGRVLTVDVAKSGPDAVELETANGLKWAPYAYDSGSGWLAADINNYWIDLDTLLMPDFADEPDPQDRADDILMAKLLYATLYNGQLSIVQRGDYELSQDYEYSDRPLALKIGSLVGSGIKVTLGLYFGRRSIKRAVVEAVEAVEEPVSALDRAIGKVSNTIQSYYSLLEETVGIVGIGLLIVLSAAAIVVTGLFLFVKYVAHDNINTGWLIAGAVSLGVLAFVIGVIKPILTIIKTVNALVDAGRFATKTSAFVGVVGGEGGPSIEANVVGLIISISLSVAFFLTLTLSGQVKAGTIAFNELLAQTIASVIVAVIFFVLNLTLIGALLVGLAALVDLILLALGIDFSITGKLISAIAGVLYQFDLTVDTDVRSGDLNTELTDPEAGIVDGNGMVYTLPITTVITETTDYLISEDDIRSNSFIYQLNFQDAYQIGLSTSNGDRADEWSVREVNTLYEATLYDSVSFQTFLSAGVNRSTIFYLDAAYDLQGASCWVGYCDSKYVDGTSSTEIGSSVIFDVLPPTIGGFADVTAWSNGGVRMADADGDGLLPFSAGGVDPDDSNWDVDGDNLSDAFEISMRALTVDEGGEQLDAMLADSDGDSILDNEELLLATNPANPDSDGDGLPDVAEAARVDGSGLGGGWLFAYSTSEVTRVWSDPNQVDYDQDGMSDLFELGQDTCPGCSPWSDPDNPLLYSPYVANENPVPLYLDDNTTDGFVPLLNPTFTFSSTTENNLSSAVSLAGEINVELPQMFSGGPLQAQVDLTSGFSQTLVSELTGLASNEKTGIVTTSMDLAAFDDVIWSWENPDSSAAASGEGSLRKVAAAASPGFSDAYVVAALEEDESGNQSITAYTSANSGPRTGGVTIKSYTAGESVVSPAVACNLSGVCLVAWGVNFPDGSGQVNATRLDGDLNDSSTGNIRVKQAGVEIHTVALAGDGQDFMASWGEVYAGGNEIMAKPVLSDGSSPVSTQSLYGPDPDTGVVGLTHTGENYLAVFSGDQQILRWAEVDSLAQVGDVQTLPAIGRTFSNVDSESQSFALAYDQLSEQALVIFNNLGNRPPSASSEDYITALRFTTAGALPEINFDTFKRLPGLASAAVCADPINGGWVVAWTKDGVFAETTTHLQAIAPDGSLRGPEGTIDSSVNNAGVGIACQVPRPLLDIEFDEGSISDSYADSSIYGNDATCDLNAGACPIGGVEGRFGNGVSFDGIDDKTDSVFDMPTDNFTIEFWMKTTCSDCDILHLLGANADMHLRNGEVCYTETGQSSTTTLCTPSDTNFADGDWHHVALINKDKLVAIYVDGQVRVAVHVNESNAHCSNNCDKFVLGKASSGFFNGSLDQVRVWSRMLSASEIDRSFSSAVTILDLDEVSGSTTAYDASHNGFNGACKGSTNCPSFGIDGAAYTAAEFDGSNDHLLIESQKRTLETFAYNFEDGDFSHWSSSTATLGTRNGGDENFLGMFGNETVSLDLVNLPTHDTLVLSFDLYVIGPWSGNRTDLGPDNWEFGLDNSTTFSSNFSNLDDSAGSYQFYPAGSWFGPQGITLYEDSDCTGDHTTFRSDDPDLSDDAIDVNRTSCIIGRADSVGIVYRDQNYEGSAAVIDLARGVLEDFDNDTISSIRVWSAANEPKHGSTGDSLSVSGTGAGSVYHIEYTFEGHTAGDASLTFKGDVEFPTLKRWGLDNVVLQVQSDGGSIPLTNSDFTLSAWINNTDGTNQWIVGQGSDATHEALNFGINGNGDLQCGVSPSGNSDNLTATIPSSTAEWRHVACTYDSPVLQLYIDGEQQAEDTSFPAYQGFGETTVGKLPYGSGLGHFEGGIDEIGIWTIALSDLEIAELASKVKVEDEATLHALVPLAQFDDFSHLYHLTLHETATDLGTESQVVTKTLTIDDDSPSATVLAPANGEYVNGNGIIQVSGTAADPTSYIGSVAVSIDSNSATAAEGTESWSATIDGRTLDEGLHMVSAIATDIVGYSGNAGTAQFIVDNSAPHIVATHVSKQRPDRNSQGQWHLTMMGSADDASVGGQPGSGLKSVEVLLEGGSNLAGNGWQQATLSGNTWSIDYLLPVVGRSHHDVEDPTGEYTALIRATDAVSNTTPADAYVSEVVSVDAGRPRPSLHNGPVAQQNVITAGGLVRGQLPAPQAAQAITTGLTLSGQIMDDSLIDSIDINFTPAAQIGALEGSILHLPLDEIVPTNFFPDQSGTNHPATCQDGECPMVGQEGRRDLAASFDGVDDNLTVGGIDLSNKSFTVAAWAKRDVIGEHHTIISQGQALTNNGFIMLFTENNTARCSFWANNLTTAVSYTDTDWHHWVCTYNASTGLRTLYRDGVVAAQDNPGTAVQGTGDLRVGVRQDNVRYFDGAIDEVMVFDRALAAYEITDLYNYGLVSWQAAAFNSSEMNPTWSFDIPEGDGGLDGIYQVNVRATDILGNRTSLDGQRLWRGEIDTRPPQLAFAALVQNGATGFSCTATDFNLDEASSCVVVPPATVPQFEIADITLATYDQVNQWYAAATGDISRLYLMDALRTYNSVEDTGVLVQACDVYGRCTISESSTIAEVNSANEIFAASSQPAIDDSQPPSVSISPLTLTAEQLVGEQIVLLSGTVSDNEGIHRVEVSINGGPWQRAGFDDQGNWQFHWSFTSPPDGQSYNVSARTTDIVGLTGTTNESVLVDVIPPGPIEINLSYEDSVGSTTAIMPGDTLVDAESLQVNWASGSDGSGIAAYNVGWSQSPTMDPASLTEFTGPGNHKQAVGEAQIWYAHVQQVDGVGNSRTQTLGPIYVDRTLTPDVVSDPDYHGWANEVCTILGVDRRMAQMHPDVHGDKIQRFYTSWDADALRFSWQGANWNHEGDLFLYIDAHNGGSDLLFNPYPDDQETVIYLPGNAPAPQSQAASRQLTALSGITQEVMGADFVVWIEDSRLATLYSWNGTAWQNDGQLDSDHYRLTIGIDGSDTDVLLPFTALGVTNPSASALSMLAVATEEDALQLWSTMPTRNPVNSARVVNPMAGESENHTFPLVRAYNWDGLGDGQCVNGRINGDGSGPTGGSFADSDLKLSLSAEPVGTTYSFINDDMAWLWPILFGVEGSSFVPSELFPHQDTDHPPLAPGQTIVYKIDYENLGTEAATGVQIVIDSWFALDLPGQIIDLEDIPAGDSGSIMIQGTVDINGLTPPESEWASLDAFVYDDQTPFDPANSPVTAPPLEWMWSDHAVNGDAPHDVSIESPQEIVGAGQTIVRGLVFGSFDLPLINLEVTDESGGVQAIACPGTSQQNGRWECVWDTSGYNDGDVFQLRAQAVDEHGQSSEWSAETTVVVDKTPPLVMVTQPSFDEQLFGTGLHTVNGSMSDDRHIGSVYFCVDEDECTTVPVRANSENDVDEGVWSSYLPQPDTAADGEEHTLTVYGIDFAGNQSVEPVVIKYRLDDTPPQLTVSQVTPQIPSGGTQLVMSGDVSDGSDFDVYILVKPPTGPRFRVKTSHSTVGAWEFAPGWTRAGTYTLWVQAVDAAGNTRAIGPFQTLVGSPPGTLVIFPVIAGGRGVPANPTSLYLPVVAGQPQAASKRAIFP